MFEKRNISNKFDHSENIVLFSGDCLKLLVTIPQASLKLVVTSPPYNIGGVVSRKMKIIETYSHS